MNNQLKMDRKWCLIGVLALTLASCHPVIRSYRFGPAQTIAPEETVYFTWKVKGTAKLSIDDRAYDPAAKPLRPVRLHIQTVTTDTNCLLTPGQPVYIPVSAEDSVRVTKIHDPVSDARIRTFALTVTKGSADSSHHTEIIILPDSSKGQITLRRNEVRGDTLIASGINDTARWHGFVILSVLDGSDRPLEIIHNHIRVLLKPGEPADQHFRGTAAEGLWEFRGLKTEDEKSNPASIARLFRIIIYVKHEEHGNTGH